MSVFMMHTNWVQHFLLINPKDMDHRSIFWFIYSIYLKNYFNNFHVNMGYMTLYNNHQYFIQWFVNFFTVSTLRLLTEVFIAFQMAFLIGYCFPLYDASLLMIDHKFYIGLISRGTGSHSINFIFLELFAKVGNNQNANMQSYMNILFP